MTTEVSYPQPNIIHRKTTFDDKIIEIDLEFPSTINTIYENNINNE